MVLFQNKLIKFYFSLAKLHQRILKTTGNDIGLVQKIKIIKFCTVCTAQPEDLERCDKTTDERSKRVRFSLDAITGKSTHSRHFFTAVSGEYIFCVIC